MTKCIGKCIGKPCRINASTQVGFHSDFCHIHQNQAPTNTQMNDNTTDFKLDSTEGKENILTLVETAQKNAKNSYCLNTLWLFIIAACTIACSFCLMIGKDKEVRRNNEDQYYAEIYEKKVVQENKKEENLEELDQLKIDFTSLKKDKEDFDEKILAIDDEIKELNTKKDQIKNNIKIIIKNFQPTLDDIIVNHDLTQMLIKINKDSNENHRKNNFFWYKNKKLTEDIKFSKIARDNGGFSISKIKLTNDFNSGWAFSRNNKAFYFKNNSEWQEDENLSNMLGTESIIKMAFSENLQQGWILSKQAQQKHVLYQLKEEQWFKLDQKLVTDFFQKFDSNDSKLTTNFKLFLNPISKNGFILKIQENGKKGLYIDEILIFKAGKWQPSKKVELTLPLFLKNGESYSYILTKNMHLISFTGNTFINISAEDGIQKISNNELVSLSLKKLRGAFFMANETKAWLILLGNYRGAFNMKIALSEPKNIKKLFIFKDDKLTSYFKNTTYIIHSFYTENLENISLITSTDENLVFQSKTWFKDNKEGYSLSNKRIKKIYFNKDFSKGLASNSNKIFILNNELNWLPITQEKRPTGLEFCLFKIDHFIPAFCKDKKGAFYFYNDKNMDKAWEKIDFKFDIKLKDKEKIVQLKKDLESKETNKEALKGKRGKSERGIKKKEKEIKKKKRSIIKNDSILESIKKRLENKENIDSKNFRRYYQGFASIAILSLCIYLMQILLNSMHREKKQEYFYTITRISIQASGGNTLLFKKFIGILSTEQNKNDKDHSDKAEHIYFKTLNMFKDTLENISKIFKMGKNK